MAIEILPGDKNLVGLGSSGFGIMAIVVGVERGFITREQGVERLEKITHFLSTADRFHGVWPHFLDGLTGKVIPYFGKYDDGGDLVETAFLMQGLLVARQYFDRDTPQESEIRSTITGFWKTVQWDWHRNGPDPNFLYWHWSPDAGFYIRHPLIGWNETMIIYLRAIASPTHAVPDVGVGNGGEIFFTHYSFMAFDPRGRRDRYADYFQNNRNIALINHDHSVENPRHFKGYGDNAWGPLRWSELGRRTATAVAVRRWTPSASTRIEPRASHNDDLFCRGQ
jgi:hypothetical protein